VHCSPHKILINEFYSYTTFFFLIHEDWYGLCYFRRFSNISKKRLLDSSRRPVLPSTWKNLAPTGGRFIKLYIWVSFENLLKKINFHGNLTKITSTLREDQYAFLTISRSVLFRMGNTSYIICREKQNTHFMLNNSFYKIVPFEIMWKNNAEQDRFDENMVHAHWMLEPITTNTHWEYVIVFGFPRHQWLHEYYSMLRYTYIGSLLNYSLVLASFLWLYFLCDLALKVFVLIAY